MLLSEHDFIFAENNTHMALYEVKMQHDEDSLVKLSHMQYDLFCQRNKTVRTLISVAVIAAAVLVVQESWLKYVLIAYAGFLLTGSYTSANRTAHKLSEQIRTSGLPFPASRFVFAEDKMHIFSLPEDKELDEPLSYKKIFRLGEDEENFYIFRDQYGGYLIPKAALGDKADEFRQFIEAKSGQNYARRATPVARMRGWLKNRNDEPYHL